MPRFFERIGASTANGFEKVRRNPTGRFDFMAGVLGAHIATRPVARYGRAENVDPFLMAAFCIAITLLMGGARAGNERVMCFSLGVMAITIGNYMITHGVEYVANHFSTPVNAP
jgi:hypothetical protein